MITWLISILLFFSSADNSFSTRLENYLEQKLSGYDKWNYEILSQDRTFFGNDSIVEIDDKREFKLTGSYGYIPVKTLRKDGGFNYSYITVKLSLYKQVYCATQNIKNGTVLSNSDFDLVEEDITHLKGKAIYKLENISGYSARLAIRTGMILLESMVEKNPVIKAGDEITAYLYNGAVSISFLATARIDGYMGEEIKIETKDKKLFTAKIKDAGNVIIVE